MKWILKIFLKIVISQLSIPYSFWKKNLVFLNMAKWTHVNMLLKFLIYILKELIRIITLRILLYLSLGTEIALHQQLLVFSYGVSKTILVDVGNFATKDIRFYKKLVMKLKKMGLRYLM